MKKIRNPIAVFFLAVAGFATLILAVFVINDIAAKLKPPNTTLAYVPEYEPEHILKIYAWSPTWNEDMNEQSIRLAEVTEDEPVSVGWLQKVRYTNDGYKNFECVIGGINNYLFYEGVFVAGGEGRISVEASTFGLEIGKKGSTPLDEVELIDADEHSVRDAALIRMRLPMRRREDSLTFSAENDVFREFDIEKLITLYPYNNEVNKDAYRYIDKNTLIVTLTDENDPERILAKAEILVTTYSGWIDLHVYEDRHYLEDPENSWHSEAVIVSYEQIEQW